MALIERSRFRTSSLIRPSETQFELPYYITTNRRGLDVNSSPFRRRQDVSAHERASLDYFSLEPELNKFIAVCFGANLLNIFTARTLFEKIRRPDIVAVDLSGKVQVIGESKTSRGEKFANEARTKRDWLPNFLDIMTFNSDAFVRFLMESFPQNELKGLIPQRLEFQEASKTDLIFLTPYTENKKILMAIGKGKFRSVEHRVPSPGTTVLAA